MTAERKPPVVAIPGLRPDSLGNYLASLGLVRVLAHHGWPGVRAAWQGDALRLVDGPPTTDELISGLCQVAAAAGWSPYERAWNRAQKQSTKKKLGKPLAVWLASADESCLETFAAHAVPAQRVSFNPLLGSGGNAGKRIFSKGQAKSVAALAGNPDLARTDLKALLLGNAVAWMIEKLNAASWFSDSNKLYNSGQQPFREGALSPWAMALACEGLAFFAGGASRRLGSRARAVGAFPFVTRAAAPTEGGEAGRDRGEVWAPLWERPMTVAEITTLFSRGRAESRGRGVLTPSAFAAAVLRRGVDAGITEFRRFVLGRTTSTNTFEPRFEGTFSLHMLSPRPSPTAPATALERVLALIDRLPRDRKVGNRWRFVGLRGHLESAMLRVAAEPNNPEHACAMLDAAVAAFDRVDRNKEFRKGRIAWEPLPIKWLATLFADEIPNAEARLAMALVSSFPKERPFALYRFGVQMDRERFVHPTQIPKQWVWRAGSSSRLLSDVLFRRVLDWEADRNGSEPVRALMPTNWTHLDRWLNGAVDEALLARWISRLALFDWRFVPRCVRSLAAHGGERIGAAGPMCLLGLFQPLLDLRPLKQPGDSDRNLLPEESGARKAAAAIVLSGLLRVGDVDGAVRFATSRYAMAGVPIASNQVPWAVGDAERLTASLLFPVFDAERSALVERWLRPRRKKEIVSS